MPRLRVFPLALALIAYTAAIVAIGAAVPSALGSAERGALRDELADSRAEVVRLTAALRLVEDERSSLRGDLNTALRELGQADVRSLDLEDRLREALGALDAATTLDGDRNQLLADYEALASQQAVAERRLAEFRPVSSVGLAQPAVYLDRAVGEVVTTRPICSGSMEPAISCSDLLVLVEPASITDLDVGDVIYYRQSAVDCGGVVDGRFMLHRINRVLSLAEGIFFETKGDARLDVDACLVASEHVLYELLAVVHDSNVSS